MKSIRGTLLLYFLALEALVLGAVSFYVYGITAADLKAKDDVTLALLEAHHKAQCKDIRDKFDEETLRRAQQVSRYVVQQWGQPLQKLSPLGVLAEMTHPGGHIAAVAWVSQGVESPLSWQLRRTTSIQLIEIVPTEDYFTVRDHWRRVRHSSDTLGIRELPLSRDMAQQMEPFTSSYQEVELQPGLPLRLVTLKVPLFQFQNTQFSAFGLPPLPPRRPSSRGDGRSSNRGSPPRVPFVTANHNVYVQYARDTEQRDAHIRELSLAARKSQQQVREETQTALASLRDQLLFVCLVTFALTVLGGTWLGQHALRPLGRIADAVSKVSEKDFHLHLAARDVPMELMPVVRRLQEALVSLEKAFAHEKQAVADISHELRTPLASLMATLQVSLRKQRPAEDYRKAMENCLEIADHLHHLIEQLLTLARLDAGALPPQTELVDVTELAEQCVEMVRPLAEEQGLTLHYHPALTVETETDAGKLKEIVTNLLSNAVQYNRPGGEITLDVRPVRGRVCVEVSDTGIGIDEDTRRHLFERFYRADPSRHANTVHAGLGLSIVKGYIDLLGGTIEVDSTLQHGSTFRVWLPLKVPAEPLAAA